MTTVHDGSTTPAPTGPHHLTGGDDELLPAVVAAVRAASTVAAQRFSTAARPETLDEVLAALSANDTAVLAVLRPALQAARPGAGWVEDELEGGLLPPGEWWVTDPVEGNINHVHGVEEWGVSATLVRDGAAVLTAVHLPVSGQTYTAVRGGGAHRDGHVLRPSAKTDLRAASVGTGQARPWEDGGTLDRTGASVAALLRAALLVRVSVPATLSLLRVADGRMDAFWQYSDVRSGLMAGALLVTEAGGTVTDASGRPWNLASTDLLAAAPGVHAAVVTALSA